MLLLRTMNGKDPIRVAIVDDDSVLGDGLRRIIDRAEGFACVGAFGSVEEATPALADVRPDVLLLDIQLPGIAGDQAIDLIRGVCPAVEILMLTVFSDRAKVFNSAKVEFRQAKFSGTQVQSIRNRIVTCIERAEGRPVAAVTKPNLVNSGWAKRRKEARRQNLNACRRGLGKR